MSRPSIHPLPKVGDMYSQLTVIAEPLIRTTKSKWVCRCICGRQVSIIGCNLQHGQSKTCGTCYKVGPTNRLGMTPNLYDRLGGAARSAIKRCTNRDHPRYADWGGRGICVYPPWVEDYLEFIEYLSTLVGCEDASLVLDRIDNNGNYEPGNLRFATRSQSQSNRRPSTQEFRVRMSLVAKERWKRKREGK